MKSTRLVPSLFAVVAVTVFSTTGIADATGPGTGAGGCTFTHGPNAGQAKPGRVPCE